MSTAPVEIETRPITRPSRPPSAELSLFFAALATLVMSFLIIFGVLGHCSPSNIAIFMVLLVVSGVLAIAGALLTVIGLRKSRDRFYFTSLLFTVLYTALLVYLLQLIDA
jgi:hypothetical protein